MSKPTETLDEIATALATTEPGVVHVYDKVVEIMNRDGYVNASVEGIFKIEPETEVYIDMADPGYPFKSRPKHAEPTNPDFSEEVYEATIARLATTLYEFYYGPGAWADMDADLEEEAGPMRANYTQDARELAELQPNLLTYRARRHL